MIDAIKSRRFALPFVGAFLLMTCLLAVPDLAWAGIAEDINAWICGVLRDCCNWIFESQVSVLSSIGVDGVLSAGFEQMLGNAGTVTMYSVARGVWEVAILPIGCGVLSFVFTVQLIKISQKMDGNASMPGVKEVVFLLVFFAVFLFIIQNSFDIMQSIYEVTKLAIDRVAGMFGAGGAVDLSQVSIATTEDDVAALIGMIVRNSVILVHQIGVEKEGGLGDWDAVVAASVSRFRPIVLTAITAICGMLPIAPTVFWGPMATAIMGGLLVATVLTLLFLPACYVLWFGIHEKNC
jgi:hypothetical protein